MKKIICERCDFKFDKIFERNFCPKCGKLHFQREDELRSLVFKKTKEIKDSFKINFLSHSASAGISLNYCVFDKFIFVEDLKEPFRSRELYSKNFIQLHFKVKKQIFIFSNLKIDEIKNHENVDLKYIIGLSKEELILFLKNFNSIESIFPLIEEKDENIKMQTKENSLMVFELLKRTKVKDISKVYKKILKENF